MSEATCGIDTGLLWSPDIASLIRATYANGTAILAGPVPGHRLQIDAAHSRARAARRLDLLDDLVARRIDHDDVVGLLVADKHQLSIVGGRHGCKPAPGKKEREPISPMQKVPIPIARRGSPTRARKGRAFRLTTWCCPIPPHYNVLEVLQ